MLMYFFLNCYCCCFHAVVTSASDCAERLPTEMTYNVSSGT